MMAKGVTAMSVDLHDVVANDVHTVALITLHVERGDRSIDVGEAQVWHFADGVARRRPDDYLPHVAQAVVQGVEVVAVIAGKAESGGESRVQVRLALPVERIEKDQLVPAPAQPVAGLVEDGPATAIVLGVLQSTYSSPKDGYKIYPLTVADVDNLGKHLEKAKGQNDPRNRCILDILDRIGSLEGLYWDNSIEQVARQALHIRSNFFDNTKILEDCIPQVLLVQGDYSQDEIAPRRLFVG